MIQLAINYFIRFGQLDIPSVGQLKLSKKEAELKDGVLIAPSEFIHLELITSNPSKQFYQYLGNALEISVDQAAIQWEQFWNHKFQEEKIATIGSLGTISKNEDNFYWQSSFDSSNYYNNIDLLYLPSKEIFEEIQTETKKDIWVIWSIVFAVVAVLAILFKQ